MNESKTPRSDKAASRDYAPLSVPYEIACQIESDLFAARNAALSEGIARGQIETELAASRAREGRLVSALGMILPEWHSDDDGTRANGEVCGEISWGDVRVVRKALEAWRTAK